MESRNSFHHNYHHSPFYEFVRSNQVLVRENSPPASSVAVTERNIQKALHLSEKLAGDSWNMPLPQHHVASWWSKIARPFSNEARRRHEKNKGRDKSEDNVTVTAATSPTNSLDNSAHSSSRQDSVRMDYNDFEFTEQDSFRQRQISQEDFCDFLNLLSLNYHKRQRSSDALTIVHHRQQSMEQLESISHPCRNVGSETSHSLPTQGKLPRVAKLQDMTHQVRTIESYDSFASQVSQGKRSLHENASSRSMNLSGRRTMSCSPAVPFPRPKKSDSPISDLSEVNEDSVAFAEYMYAKATWRMYDRIMSARMKADEARRQSLNYHSMPPVMKVPLPRGPNFDNIYKLPTCKRTDCTLSPIHDSYDGEGEQDGSESFPPLVSSSLLEEDTNSSVSGNIDHEAILFSLDIDS